MNGVSSMNERASAPVTSIKALRRTTSVGTIDSLAAPEEEEGADIPPSPGEVLSGCVLRVGLLFVLLSRVLRHFAAK